MAEGLPRACAACGRPLDPEVHYLMRVEFISTPASPALAEAGAETGAEIGRLLRAIDALTEEELVDSVYSRDEYFVCAACRGPLRRHALLAGRLPPDPPERPASEPRG